MDEEIWKDIKNHEGLYQVSNLGRIRSLYNYKRNGTNILKPRLKHNYYQIGLRKDSIRKWYQVHRLVAQAFIPNPDNLPQVNHKDENKLNNNVDNLEWCTVAYNNTYGTRLQKVSENNKLRKEVLKFDINGDFIEEYSSVREATEKNNLKSLANISQCCNKKRRSVKGYVFRFKEEVVPCLSNM